MHLAGDAPGSPGSADMLGLAAAGGCTVLGGLLHPLGALCGLRAVPTAEGWDSLFPCWREPSKLGPWLQRVAQPGAPCLSRGER